MQVPSGRAVGVVGANGAGKTTLLACVAGQARLDDGRVVWAGAPVRLGDWRYKARVSYVRDVPALYGELTVGQMVAFVARMHPTWDHSRARELVQRFALDPNKRVRELSRGMKAKLGLLLGVSHDVGLLLLDEVTAGVDPDTRDDIQQFLRGLVRERGVSVLISSHIFEDIEHIADDVLILRHGQGVFFGSATADGTTVRELYFKFRSDS